MTGETAKERLAFLLPNLRGGGAERVALTIIRDFVARGHPVDLVLVRAEGDLLPLVPRGVEIVDLAAPRLLGAIRPLARYLRRRRPAGLQARMWPLTIVAILARLAARVPTRVVVSDHVALSEQYGRQPRTFAALKATVRFLYPRAHARVLVSAGAADDLARISGIPRDRFTVIHNPVPAIEPRPDQAIDALWGDAAFRIVTAGSLKQQKNHALLIDAFARVREHRDARLMLVGEGELRDALEADVAARGLGSSVVFAGFVANPVDYIATANLFVLSSDYEGFGNVLVEAMRLGVPVVSTDCRSGPSEILDGGRFGRLVPCGDGAALAEAIEAELDAPTPPGLLEARADAISGQRSIDRYLELLLGRPSAATS
jgi:glycosyltransferase involved in cell wall biosynthesis